MEQGRRRHLWERSSPQLHCYGHHCTGKREAFAHGSRRQESSGRNSKSTGVPRADVKEKLRWQSRVCLLMGASLPRQKPDSEGTRHVRWPSLCFSTGRHSSSTCLQCIAVGATGMEGAELDEDRINAPSETDLNIQGSILRPVRARLRRDFSSISQPHDCIYGLERRPACLPACLPARHCSCALSPVIRLPLRPSDCSSPGSLPTDSQRSPP